MELATKSGISLPTIQNIESGKANPSLEIKVSAPGFQVEMAILLGVPLSSNQSTSVIKPSRDMLCLEARKWAHYSRENIFSERELLAHDL
jgi:DNA-binding XRE family transcriptional regulator